MQTANFNFKRVNDLRHPLDCWQKSRPMVKRYSGVTDARGSFLKAKDKGRVLFNSINEFQERQIFFSTSKKGVLRGMHYMSGDCASDRWLLVLRGRIQDVVVKVPTRRFEPTELENNTLSADGNNLMFIPKEWAHGFYAFNEVVLAYFFEKSYRPDCDNGIRWDSFGFQWADRAPIISDRDASLPAYHEIIGVDAGAPVT
jgi:dTDP-4-dehydrorhamnose 3,5-epimerase